MCKMRKGCFKIRKNVGSGAGEMPQHGSMHVTKTEDLSSIAGTHMVGGEN